MKKSLLLIICVASFGILQAQNTRYSDVKIHTDHEGMVRLAKLGMAIDEGMFDKAGFWSTVLSETELAKVKKAGFTCEVIHEDYTRFVVERNNAFLEEMKNINAKLKWNGNTDVSQYPVPAGFELGSMGGYYTFLEMQHELDTLFFEFPDLITQKVPVSPINSSEGRPIYFVKISDNPNINENEPKVLFTALTHAREPVGMQQLFFFMNYLLENYSTNEEVKYLVDNLELFFIPVVNPDGYVYNQNTSSGGGGMWRKNRRVNSPSCWGVDLNRNFGYEWGHDDVGSSPIPDDETYRGPSAFSEPETQNVRDLCISKGFRSALNYHTYSDIFLYPWGYEELVTPDNGTFSTFSDIMTRENRLNFGTCWQLLYTANGGIDDWMYGEETAKPKAFSFTPELGGSSDGFWAPVWRIIPMCQENMYQNLMHAHLALKYAETKDKSPVIIENREGYLKFEFRRYGQEPGDYQVSIEPIDPSQMISVGPSITHVNPTLSQPLADSIFYLLDPSMAPGTEFKYMIKIDNGKYIFRDTITKFFGTPLVIFQDSCNTMENWSSTKWNTTAGQFFSPPKCITDSPGQNYSNNASNAISMTNPVTLTNSPVAVLEYRVRWATEKVYDYIQIKLSDNNGFTWMPLKGKYTINGSDFEDPGKPVYEGNQFMWVKEEIPLAGYQNKDILVRFILTSDAGTTGDGFYFDDFKVKVIDMTTDIPEGKEATLGYISGPAPNPARKDATISYRINDGEYQELGCFLKLTDSRGLLIKEIPITSQNGNLSINVTSIPSGVYLYRIESLRGTTGVKKLVIVH